jgi:ABC-type Fe3+ transport system permease subunit
LLPGLLASWYGIHYSGLINPALVPTPHEVAARFIELMGSRLPLDIIMSTRRVFLGVLCGIALAVPVGFVLGWYRAIRTFIDPLINFFRALPPIALIPLVIVYFGVDKVAKTVILFYASFFAGVIVMYEGISQISPIYVRVARTLGASDGEIFRKIIIPLAVPRARLSRATAGPSPSSMRRWRALLRRVVDQTVKLGLVRSAVRSRHSPTAVPGSCVTFSARAAVAALLRRAPISRFRPHEY